MSNSNDCHPLPVGENFDPPSIFSPWVISSFPQEASVILVPINCQIRLTAISWSEKSSAYKLFKVSRVMNDFEIALNKVNPKNLFSMLLLNQYHFQNYFCVTILSSPWLIQKNLIPLSPKKFLPVSENFPFLP